MPTPPVTVDAFVRLVRKSKLAADGRLDTYLASPAAAGAATPADLAAAMVGDGLLTRFQADQLLAGKYRGFMLGKYRILDRLGAGGMGTVLLCEHAHLRHRVAVKVLPPDKARDPAAVGRFYREARAAARLDHPNLVRAHDIDRDADHHFLVLEYVDGVSLYEVVRRHGPLSVTLACHYVRQAALGLQHAHEAGLVHRDVKPGNLLLDRQGTVKVADLGLARIRDDDEEGGPLTHRYDGNSLLGSADYFAPEQALDSHSADTRADVYSLGCTFYFLLAGRPPFPQGNVMQKLLCHQMREPAPVRELRPEVPEALAEVLATMMRKRPGDRFQTPAEVAAALAPWTAEPPPPPDPDDFRPLNPAARGTGPGPAGPSTPTPVNGAGALVLPLLPRPGPKDGTGGTPEVRRPPARLARLVVGITTAAAAAAAALCWMLFFSPNAPPRGGQADGVCLVRDGSAEELECASLAEAIGLARPGDRVVVRADVLAETVRLRGDGNLGRDVRVEGLSASGGPVRWRPPEGHDRGRPLLDVSDVAGLCLRGFVLDGEGRADDLVVLSGRCPGLSLSDLTLRGFGRSAVRFQGVEGVPLRPVLLERVRAVADTRADAALVFAGEAGQVNHHVHVRGGRFEGPYLAAVLLAGPVADAEFRGNRFFRARDGVLYRRADPPPRARLTLASNTFYEIEHALRFEEAPDGDDVVLAVSNNLFGRVGRLAVVDGFAPGRATAAAWVWSDEGQASGPRYFRKAFDLPGPGAARGVLDVVADDSFAAWLNGRRVGEGRLSPDSRRVYSFDVTPLLRPGKNVLAVRAENRAGGGGLLAQLGFATEGGAAPAVVTDRAWKVAASAPDGWQRPEFDDSAWPAARVRAEYGEGGDRQELVWDAAVRERFRSEYPLVPAPHSNVRDFSSRDGFPPLRARYVVPFALPIDADNDAEFLRYPKSSDLSKAGLDGGPVGVPFPE